jgi:intracellular sulfur oxidation DsrE/DsrF family protein
MQNKHILAILSMSLIASICQPAWADASAPAHHKVVFQVSDGDPAKWGLTLNNVSNLQDAMGDKNVDIEVVVYGPGIGMLKMESPVGDRINDAVNAGVKVVACENTMKAKNLTKDNMLASIGYVPGGVVEIITKESQGWSYVRP